MFENEIVKEVAANHGKTPAQVALRFLIQNDISIVPKSANIDRIKQNIDVFDFSLSDDEMAALATLDTAEPIIGGNAEKPEKVEEAMKWCLDYTIE